MRPAWFLIAAAGVQVGGKPLVSLPRKTINIVTVDLTPDDRRKYER